MAWGSPYALGYPEFGTPPPDDFGTHVEDIVCELPGISEREELSIDLLELYETISNQVPCWSPPLELA